MAFEYIKDAIPMAQEFLNCIDLLDKLSNLCFEYSGIVTKLH